MSIEAMAWAMDQQTVTNPTDRLVLIILANSAREDGTAAFPSISLICRRSGLARRTVINALQRLQDAGVIRPGNQKVVAAHISRPDMRPNTYDLVMSDGVHLTTERGASDDNNGVHQMHPAAERGASDDCNGVHLTTERGAPDAPDPSLTILKTLTPLTPQGDDDEDFEAFWQEYPHRGGRKKNRRGALAKWRQAIKSGVTAEKIMAGVARLADDRDVRRGFARDPATWLNQRGWEDEQVAATGLMPADEPRLHQQRVTPSGKVQAWDGFRWVTEAGVRPEDVRGLEHV